MKHHSIHNTEAEAQKHHFLLPYLRELYPGKQLSYAHKGRSNYNWIVSEDHQKKFIKVAPVSRIINETPEIKVLNFLKPSSEISTPQLNHTQSLFIQNQSFAIKEFDYLHLRSLHTLDHSVPLDDILPYLTYMELLVPELQKMASDKTLPFSRQLNHLSTLAYHNKPIKGPLCGYLQKTLPTFLTKSREIIHLLHQKLSSAQPQWLHGDLQPENFVWNITTHSTMLLDWEDVEYNYPELEWAHFILNFLKAGHYENTLEINISQYVWLVDHISIISEESKNFLKNEFPILFRYFCMNQSLIYFDRALRNIWTLQPGIGFLPCYNNVIHDN